MDDLRGLGFALENQTRPIYSKDFFHDRLQGDAVVVHELAHQWVGDSISVEAWQHIWLNEGFATYAEWLWSEREGLGTVQEIFDSIASTPADNPFWSVRIGDPGPDAIFDSAVYARGAMTLHALRQPSATRTSSASCASGRNSMPAATSPQLISSPSPKRSRARN